MDALLSNLTDLVYELRDHRMPLMIGGGFGLFLKRKESGAQNVRTLLQILPESRSTNDLDLFLRVEVLADLTRIQDLASVLARLSYQSVPGAEYMQWKRAINVAGVPQEVKLDFLVGPLGSARSHLHVSNPRARPKGDVKFHAHRVEEAVGIEDEPVAISFPSKRSNGEAYQVTVEVPHPFPYLLMKLAAFADRKDDADKDLGRHHAMDIYTIVALLTEDEYERSKELGRIHRENEYVLRSRRTIEEHFLPTDGIGRLRLREHSHYRPGFELDRMVSVLAEIFAASTQI